MAFIQHCIDVDSTSLRLYNVILTSMQRHVVYTVALTSMHRHDVYTTSLWRWWFVKTFIQHCIDVDATSWRCIDINATLDKRHVPARRHFMKRNIRKRASDVCAKSRLKSAYTLAFFSSSDFRFVVQSSSLFYHSDDKLIHIVSFVCIDPVMERLHVPNKCV